MLALVEVSLGQRLMGRLLALGRSITEQLIIILFELNRKIELITSYNQMSNQSPSSQPQAEDDAKLPLKSIQPQDEKVQEIKNRPRPEPAQKDKVKKKRKLLSFDEDLEEPIEKVKICKADTVVKQKKKINILHSSKKELEDHLTTQFLKKKQQLDEQMFQFDYSYWDGTSVVKKLQRKKKEKVIDLIEVCRLELISNFQNLASISAKDLLLVAKDFILPHKMSISQAEALELKTAKGDNLFNFKNVKIKDITLSVNMETPIRIVEKSRYEKNIGNYPFNTWHTMTFE